MPKNILKNLEGLTPDESAKLLELERSVALDEANAWQVRFNRACWDDDTLPRYHEENTITKATRPCQQPDIGG